MQLVNSSKSMWIVTTLALIPMNACLRPATGGIGDYSGRSGSSLTAIDMSMPETSEFQSRSPELADLIQNNRFGYRLNIAPVQSDCSGATVIDQAAVYGSNLRISSSIRQGCDYSVTVELGELAETGAALQKVYFRNEPALVINRSDIAGKENYQAAISLKAVDVGNSTGPIQPSAYPAEKDVDVINAAGAVVKLSSLFVGEYLLLDFSQSGCGACVTMAQNMERDSTFKNAFDGKPGSCAFATVVPNSDRSRWLSRFPATGLTGSHTIAPEAGGFSAVASKFGYSIRATPTFLLINNKGELVGEGIGRFPSQLSQLCNM